MKKNTFSYQSHNKNSSMSCTKFISGVGLSDVTGSLFGICIDIMLDHLSLVWLWA